MRPVIRVTHAPVGLAPATPARPRRASDTWCVVHGDGDPVMSTANEALVRTAYAAYEQGDVTALLDTVDPNLEWTYLDPSEANPEPQICHGRGELEIALQRQLRRGLSAQLEELIANGDQVMVTVRIPGVEAHRVRHANERNYDVLTVRDGHIVAIRACRDRAEALAIAGIS